MAQVDRDTLIEEAQQFGIETEGLTTIAALKKAIAAKKREDSGESRGDESTEERKERKEAARKKTPTAKPKKSQSRPHISNLYPWAVNRLKVERAHIAVHNEIASEVGNGKSHPSDEDTEQRVMDHYTLHGGFVNGQEKVTTVGRMRPIKAGMTTDQVVHGTSADAGDVDDDSDEDEDD